jgi:hypothetical protein
MTTDDRSADQTEDPRRQGTGSGGYPESNPQETTPREGTDLGPEAGQAGGGDTGDAPSTSTPEEADREDTTGNPGAAG